MGDSPSILTIGHLVLEIAALEPAVDFYRDGLGFTVVGRDLWPGCAGRHAVLDSGDKRLVLMETAPVRDRSEGGVHQAYRMSQSTRDRVIERLTALGSEIHTYQETRPAEIDENVYVLDPSGNRIQLVRARDDSPTVAIDHICFEDSNLHRAEVFYHQILGLPLDHVSGIRTGDFERAREWGNGTLSMMPGSCRLVRYYRAIKDQKQTQPRPNLQMYFQAGDGVIGVYMAMDDYAEPPQEQHIGSPRVGLRMPGNSLDSVAKLLQANQHPFEGPVTHRGSSPIERSLYCKDAGGNFIELYESRQLTAPAAIP